MGDLYEIYRDGQYVDSVIACSDEEAQEQAKKEYGPGEYTAKPQKRTRAFQVRSGRRGQAW